MKQLLNAMVVDPKNPGQCILQVPSIKIEDGEAPDARRLWVFGAVTTESGPRSIKAAHGGRGHQLITCSIMPSSPNQLDRTESLYHGATGLHDTNSNLKVN